jgi:hypothetical protein
MGGIVNPVEIFLGLSSNGDWDLQGMWLVWRGEEVHTYVTIRGTTSFLRRKLMHGVSDFLGIDWVDTGLKGPECGFENSSASSTELKLCTYSSTPPNTPSWRVQGQFCYVLLAVYGCRVCYKCHCLEGLLSHFVLSPLNLNTVTGRSVIQRSPTECGVSLCVVQ